MQVIISLSCLLQASLDETRSGKDASEQELSKKVQDLQEQLAKLTTDKQSTESKLNSILDELHRKLLSKWWKGGFVSMDDHNTFVTVNKTNKTIGITTKPS